MRHVLPCMYRRPGTSACLRFSFSHRALVRASGLYQGAEWSMATITKKELIDRIAEAEGCKRVLVKRIVQSFLDSIIDELSNGNRLEFRDFGVFESRIRAARQAQNPKTMEKVPVPPKRTVKFKVGRIMKERLHATPAQIDEATGLAVEPSAGRGLGRHR